MSTKLWGGRFDMPTNKLVESYNATIMLEQRLCPFDIQGSIAHATMLGRQGIITQDEANAIIGGLIKRLRKGNSFLIPLMKIFIWR